MPNEATVFIVDDEPDIRRSLRWLIESVGLRVDSHSSAREFLENYDPDTPGCIVLDVRMQGMSGLELQDVLNDRGFEIPVIVITAHADVPMAVRAMKAGAVHFLQKPFSDQVLLDGIHEAIERDSENRALRARRREIAARLRELTARERQVMQLVVEGLTSREIGNRLGVAQKTVEAHRARIMKKMQAENLSQLIHMRLVGDQNGQVEPGGGAEISPGETNNSARTRTRESAGLQ